MAYGKRFTTLKDPMDKHLKGPIEAFCDLSNSAGVFYFEYSPRNVSFFPHLELELVMNADPGGSRVNGTCVANN